MGVRNFNLWSSLVRKRGKIGLNKSFLFPAVTPVFLFVPLKLCSQKNYSTNQIKNGDRFFDFCISCHKKSFSLMLVIRVLYMSCKSCVYMNQLVNCGHTPSEPFNIWLGAWMQTYIHVSQPVLGKWEKVIKWLKEPERKKNLKLGRFYDVYNI